jgi:hypothetical protein
MGRGEVHFHANMDELGLHGVWHCRTSNVIGAEDRSLALLGSNNLLFRHLFQQ